ncbi:alpha/beta fold hydrolase [Candidatus Neomarinimicrobiota bacterium]
MNNKTLGLIIVSCIMLITSCQNNESKIPPIVKSDKFVDIGTHKLRVVLSEVKSEYTIVLEAGGGVFSDAYQEIQDTLAKLTNTRVISYDRSGFGKSELGPDNFITIDEVNALKKCLEVQGFKNKYILVGHSYGGLLVQLFALRYPDLVSGLVLIDPMNVKFVDRFGLDKLNSVTPYFENPTENWQKAGNRMVDNFPKALKVLREKELHNQIPTLLLTAGNPMVPEIWRECHEQMVMNSENHKLLIAEGNNHDITSENPDIVINTIIELINTINAN